MPRALKYESHRHGLRVNEENVTVALDRGASVDSSLVSVPTTLPVVAVYAVSTPLVVSRGAGPRAFIKVCCLSRVVGLHPHYPLYMCCFGVHVDAYELTPLHRQFLVAPCQSYTCPRLVSLLRS